jgi:predicted amidohydrolase
MRRRIPPDHGKEDGMSRIVRVAATSMATLEASPPFNQRTPDPDDNLKLGLSILEAAGAQRADLACLPEGFMLAGIPTARLRSLAEPLSGPGVRAVADCARRHGMYVVAGFYVLEQGSVSNLAALFDRSGNLVCTYSKVHPTEYEIDDGVISGSEVTVFDADFGRVGFAICFDLNWPDLWRRLKEKGVELVCWISAYEGGFPLQTYAWQHQFPIVTSVWSYHAKVIERSGRVAAATSRWGRIATLDLNLEKQLFHTDCHAHLLLPMQERYGDRVRIETFTEEHLFTLESLDPQLSIGDIVSEFGLTDYLAYIDRSARKQEAARSNRPPAP